MIIITNSNDNKNPASGARRPKAGQPRMRRVRLRKPTCGKKHASFDLFLDNIIFVVLACGENTTNGIARIFGF